MRLFVAVDLPMDGEFNKKAIDEMARRIAAHIISTEQVNGVMVTDESEVIRQISTGLDAITPNSYKRTWVYHSCKPSNSN